MEEKRMIDADEKQIIIQALKMHHDSQFTPGVYEHSVFGKAALLLESTVDAVEVVRCSSCQHSTLPAVLTQRYGEPGTLTCHNWKSPCNKRNVKADGFCSYGERRTDG